MLACGCAIVKQLRWGAAQVPSWQKNGSGVALQLMGQQLQQLHPFYFLRGVEWSYQAVAGSFSRCLDAVQKTQACGAGNAIDRLRQLPASRERAVRPRVFRLRSTPNMQDMRNTVTLSKPKAKPKAQSPRQAELAQA